VSKKSAEKVEVEKKQKKVFFSSSLFPKNEMSLHLTRDSSARGSVLVVRNLTARAGGTPILEDVSFTLKSGRRLENGDGSSTSIAGSIAFVRGPSGGGKTALLRTVASLEPVDEGALLLDGLLPEAWGPAAWRSRVCYVPQSRLRLPGSPADLFAEASRFAAQADRRAASPSAPAAAAACSPASPLDSVASSLLLDAGLVHRPWETLSGGQAARAALAVAMALDPPFLLVDEPTAALDASAAAAVERALAECGSAVLWVTHDEGQPGRVGGRVYDLVPGVVASRGGGERRGGGGESGRENDGGESSNSVPPVVVISPGRLVGGDWVGPKRGR